MPDPPTPTTVQITLAHLFSLIAGLFSLIAVLVGYLWTLTIERIKKAETRLDDGSKTINGFKVSLAETDNDVDHIVLSMRDHYKSSDEYRHETSDKIAKNESDIQSIKTRCIEREKAGKP
jgi:hypothetical protein